MSLMAMAGSEMIRYNPSSNSIESSTNRGMTWFKRVSCSGMGRIRALVSHKGELVLCSDQGIYFSSNKGLTWFKRNSSDRNFVDMQDLGTELMATTSDGRVYVSSFGGFCWFKRG